MRTILRSKRFLILSALVMITVIGTAAAVTVLFTHTFPSVTVPGVAPLVTSNPNCSSLVLAGVGPTTASGIAVFTCISTTTSPFAFSTGSRAVAVSATGSIPAGYTDLYVTPAPTIPSPTCALTAGSVAILSSNPGTGTALTVTAATPSPPGGLSANSFYNYCADYSNTSLQPLVIPTFTVDWQQ
ncbi:MAG TPA: hypothetical protein VGS11_01050 [Candidatus Bathyarchaeia archaeon]|nr:hypothetical protein [Candidatus Bathyarchaeia archaeon]